MTGAIHFETLIEGLIDSLDKHRTRPALEVGEENLSYHQLFQQASRIASEITARQGRDTPGFVALFGSRSPTVYAGLLGIVLSGNAYVPVSPRLPVGRLRHMLEASGADVVIVAEECAELFAACASDLKGLQVICPLPEEKCRALLDALPQHDVALELTATPVRPAGTQPADPAYLLFTSGTTGVPKGVVVSNHNVCSYLRHGLRRYEVASSDRLSQMFDLTFDLSVHDLFIGWLSGACVCVVPDDATMAPAKFIRHKSLTLWFSVPAVAMFMSRMGALRPGAFPSLRCSLFCGEALPAALARAWQEAAPNSVVDNLYGPTEATIAITSYRWDPEVSALECVNGIVPIGWPFPEHTTRIVDQDMQTVVAGEAGELCVAGPQVTAGYLGNPEQTSARYVELGGFATKPWYRTGDLVREAPAGCLVYLGRVDEQIQVRGYRVELLEVDNALRTAAGTELAIAVPQELHDGSADSLIAVVQGADDATLRQEILRACRSALPDYMVPAEVHFVDRLPLNVNGKIDRRALAERPSEAPATAFGDSVREFIADKVRARAVELGLAHDDLRPADQESLVGPGALDSLAFLDLLGAIEETFGLDLDVSEMDPEFFTTIGGILEAVSAAKRRPSSGDESASSADVISDGGGYVRLTPTHRHWHTLPRLLRAEYDGFAHHGLRISLREHGEDIWLRGLGTSSERTTVVIGYVTGEHLAGFVQASLRLLPPYLAGQVIGVIDHLYVTPELRRSGVATRLVDDALAWLANRKVESVELQVLGGNAAGRAFWERLGFHSELTQMRRDSA